MEIKSWAQAKSEGESLYFTGVPCKHGHVAARRVVNKNCIECAAINNAAYKAKRELANPGRNMWERAKYRASQKGIPFSITLDDIVIPTHCPILGVELESNDHRYIHPNSPSLDRIVPELGYVPGNVHVISNRANTIKNDASIDELKMLVEYLEHLQ